MATRLVLILLTLLSPCATVQATTITFTAIDLADAIAGEDLWRYDYSVGGRSFFQFEFFDIYFAPSLYGTLTAGPSPSPDWDAAILQQPNPANLPPFDSGIFDAFALTDNPSLLGAFSVNFIYLGPGTPGSQEFAIFDANSGLIECGVTTVPGQQAIPEPSTAAFCLIGLVAVAIYTHRRTAVLR